MRFPFKNIILLKWSIVVGGLLALFAMDMAFHSSQTVIPGSFRADSLFKAPPAAATTVAVVASDNSSLTNPVAVTSSTLTFAQIKEMADLIDNLSQEQYNLKEATITNVKALGSGDRVCIDTTSMMVPGEGMLVGSYSKAMFLVHSESLESEYVASRPFRVNAGPVQAYVMVPGNKTRYLAELEAGDEVLIVNQDGTTRQSIVGRCKIEKRPLLLLEAEYEDVKIKSLLQNAETIRVVSADDEAVSVSDLKPGDKVKVFIDESARHFGMAIDETIIEK